MSKIYSQTIHDIDRHAGYCRRLLVMRGVKYPSVFNASIADGIATVEGRECRTISQIADAINAYLWFEAATNRITINPEDLVPQDLSILSAPKSMDDDETIQLALNKAREYPSLAAAWDPPMTEESILRIPNVAALESFFIHGNWCCGTGALYGSTVFIEATDGAGEYLVIDREIGCLGFWSAEVALRRDHQAVEDYLENLQEYRIAA